MRTLLFFIILICLSVNINAQNNYKKGYVITNNRDTIHGYINYRTNKINQEECMFKTDKNSKDTQLFHSKDLYGYRIESPSKYYIRKSISNTKDANSQNEIFVEYLVSGFTDLFYFYDSEQDLTFFIFEENGKDPLYITQQPEIVSNGISRTDTKYRGILRYKFQDYPEILKEIEKLKFDQKSMIKVAKMYDDANCTPTSNKCIIYESNTPDKLGLKFKFSAYTGIQQTQYTFKNIVAANGNQAKTKGTSLSPIIGIQLYMYNPRFSESWGISVETSIAKIKDDIESQYYSYSYKAYCSTSKIGVRYTYPKFRIKPFLEIGVAFSALFNSSCERITLSNQNKISYHLRSSTIGAYSGIGCEYQTYKTQSIFLRFNYDFYMNNNRIQENGSDKFNSWQLKLGYTF